MQRVHTGQTCDERGRHHGGVSPQCNTHSGAGDHRSGYGAAAITAECRRSATLTAAQATAGAREPSHHRLGYGASGSRAAVQQATHNRQQRQQEALCHRQRRGQGNTQDCGSAPPPRGEMGSGAAGTNSTQRSRPTESNWRRDPASPRN